MSHWLLVMIWKYFTLQKKSDLGTWLSHSFLLATWGDINSNWLVSTPSSVLTSQKSKKIEKRLLSLNIAIKLHQTARFDSFLTSLTQVWSLVTFYRLIWPQIIRISFRGKILSRNICIFELFRPIGLIWPLFDDLTRVWPLMTLIDLGKY